MPPLDVEVMREAAHRLLAEDAELPTDDELETLTLQLRGHLMLAIPIIEALAEQLPEDDAPRACAHSAVAQARTHLNQRPWPIRPRRVQHAQHLARSVNALCDHYENLQSDRPAVLDEQQAALLKWWNHCLTCETCSTLDDAGRNANLHCETAQQLYQAYRRARSPRAGLPAAEGRA